MNILFFTDCMAIGPEYYEKTEMYPDIIQKQFAVQYGVNVDIEIISGSGETSSEAIEKLKDIETSNKKYDLILFGYGINDALPRGLKRSTRGKIIRFMYKLKLNEKARLFARSFFLNPLEFVMLFLRKPIHYNDIDTYSKNIKFILNELKDYNGGNLIHISLSPVLNYRFRKANDYIRIYNDHMIKELDSLNVISVDVFNLFCKHGIAECLSIDKFHYSKKGHELVAGEIISLMGKIFDVQRLNK